jgi:hypothetical protein
MSRGLLWTIAAMFALIAVVTTVSAASLGPYDKGTLTGDAAGYWYVSCTLDNTDLRGTAQNGDQVLIRINYNLRALGSADGADAYLWYEDSWQVDPGYQHVGTDSQASGQMVISRYVTTGQVYNYFDRVEVKDWGVVKNSCTVEKQLLT